MQTTHLESKYDDSTQRKRQPIEHDLYLTMIGIFAIYTLVYIIRYIHWRMKQRKRKIRLLEYERLRWLWNEYHQKQTSHLNRPTVHRKESDNDDCLYFDRSSSSSSSSLSVTTINENENELEHHRDSNCDDREQSRTSSLVLTIPAPAYHSHNPLSNPERAHRQHKHHNHQCSVISNTHASTNVESYYSSSSSTTTLACSCRMNRSLNTEEKNSCTSFTSSPTTTPSPFDPTLTFYYGQYNDLTNQTNNSKSERIREGGGDDSHHDVVLPMYKKTSYTSFPSPCWPFQDTKAKRRKMIWKWSVAMGHCHYDHAKTITSIIDQLDKPPSH